MSSQAAIEYAEKNMDVILFPYELAEGMDESRQVINDIVELARQKKIRIGVFVGPEGGFAESEAEKLKKAGAKTISLGHRILRTETAGMTVMSILSFLLDS